MIEEDDDLSENECICAYQIICKDTTFSEMIHYFPSNFFFGCVDEVCLVIKTHYCIKKSVLITVNEKCYSVTVFYSLS
jgi:hypothetical protein